MWAVFNGGKPPAFTADELTAGAAASALPPALARTSPFMEHPVFNSHHSELQMTRYAFGRVSDTGALTTRPAPHLSPRSSLLPLLQVHLQAREQGPLDGALHDPAGLVHDEAQRHRRDDPDHVTATH